MSGPVSCSEAAELIPWLANGTLCTPQSTALESHLQRCGTCRQDFEAQRRLYEAMRAPGSLVFATEPSFKKLLDRLETTESAPTPAEDVGEPIARALPSGVHPQVSHRPARPVLTRWLTAAVVVQALGLGAGAWLWHARGAPQRTGEYVTLTAPVAPWSSERIRVLFRQEVSIDELARLLHGIDARVIDGPTEANVYTLGFRDRASRAASLDARLAALRASPAVLFAEPVARDAH